MCAETRIALLGAAFGGLIALAGPVFAQALQTQFVPSAGSPAASGACMYGGSGELLHAPKGAICPKREQPPVSAAPPASRDAAGALPYRVRAELREQLAESTALDVEIARARQAVSHEDGEAARVVNDALSKLARHLEREAQLLKQLTAGSAAPQ